MPFSLAFFVSLFLSVKQALKFKLLLITVFFNFSIAALVKTEVLLSKLYIQSVQPKCMWTKL